MNETKSATEGEDCINFGSYSLTIVFNWKDQYLDIINRRTNK